MTHTVVIPADRKQPIYDWEWDGKLESLILKVDGDVEAKVARTSAPEQFLLYINTDGKRLVKPYNLRATGLVRNVLRYDDFIVGDAVLVGLPDEDGHDTDAPFTAVDGVLTRKEEDEQTNIR